MMINIFEFMTNIELNILLAIALILLSTKFMSIFTRKIHLPQVVGALLAGILMGPAIFNVIKSNETISMLAELGVIIMLFSAGLETDLKQLRSSFKSSLIISIFGIAAPLGGGFAVAFLFGKPSFESFFIGFIISSTSASIAIETLHEMGKLKTKSGTSLLGAAIIDDILSIIIFAVIMGLGKSSFSVATIIIILVKIIGFFIFALVCGLAIHKLFDFMDVKFGHKRRLSIFALAFCFLMAYIAEEFGLANIIGAYIAGVALCTTRCGEYLETKISVISYMFFTPIFLANIGLQISFSNFGSSIILFTVILVVIAIVSEIIACALGAKICGFSNRESIQLGMGMIARGEVAIIVANKGIEANFIDSQGFSSIIVVILVTVIITPILLKFAYAEKNKKPEIN